MGWVRIMKVLITGGTGFLGQALARRLHAMSYQVTVTGRKEAIGNKLAKEGIQFLKANLEDEGAMIQAVNEMDYVFHCGAFSSPWGDYEDFYQTNVIGTENVIEACMRHQVKRLIHVSTPSLYFGRKDRREVKEEDRLPDKFLNHYAETKYLAEQKIDEAHQQGLPVITIRPRAVFGPGDTSIIPRLIKANEQKFVPLVNGGKIPIDLTYVENVVDALLLCMDSEQKTLGEKYNISNGEEMILADVLQKLFLELDIPFHYRKLPYSLVYAAAFLMEKKALIGKSKQEPLLTRYSVTVLSKAQTVNIDKARKELNYLPRITVQEGIKLFSKWWVKTDD